MPDHAMEIVVDADGDLEKRVRENLKSHHRPAWRQISVSADDGIVKLRGRVGSFHEKQLCQQACREVDGVVELIDELLVAPS